MLVLHSIVAAIIRVGKRSCRVRDVVAEGPYRQEAMWVAERSAGPSLLKLRTSDVAQTRWFRAGRLSLCMTDPHVLHIGPSCVRYHTYHVHRLGLPDSAKMPYRTKVPTIRRGIGSCRYKRSSWFPL